MLKSYRVLFYVGLFTLGLLSACGAATETPAPPAPTAVEAIAPNDAAVVNAPATSKAVVDAPTAGGADVFTIVSNETTARFLIDEVLAGSPNTVIGETQDVGGEIRIDPSDPASVEVGAIQIAAASFVTDNNFRNRAINSFILQTGNFPFITFKATEVVGLPGSVAVGDQFAFQLVGELTIRDITQPVTFEVSVTAESSTHISGTARATINRTDFDLSSPSVPQVASVDEQVQLELDFVAMSGG